MLRSVSPRPLTSLCLKQRLCSRAFGVAEDDCAALRAPAVIVHSHDDVGAGTRRPYRVSPFLASRRP